MIATWSSYFCPNNINLYTLLHLHMDNINLTYLRCVSFVLDIYMYIQVSMNVVTLIIALPRAETCQSFHNTDYWEVSVHTVSLLVDL
jgi:hypothetical protein